MDRFKDYDSYNKHKDKQTNESDDSKLNIDFKWDSQKEQIFKSIQQSKNSAHMYSIFPEFWLDKLEDKNLIGVMGFLFQFDMPNTKGHIFMELPELYGADELSMKDEFIETEDAKIRFGFQDVQTYSGNLTVSVDIQCQLNYSGDITGRKVVSLEDISIQDTDNPNEYPIIISKNSQPIKFHINDLNIKNTTAKNPIDANRPIKTIVRNLERTITKILTTHGNFRDGISIQKTDLIIPPKSREKLHTAIGDNWMTIIDLLTEKNCDKNLIIEFVPKEYLNKSHLRGIVKGRDYGV